MNQDAAMIRMWRPEINLLKERVKAANMQKITAFYGSSSIRLWDELQTDLSPHPVINLGFGGSSYWWCDHFFEEVFDGLNPEEVILYAGDNDLGNEVPQDEILTSVKSILLKIDDKYGAAPVSIISVKPSPDRLYLKDKIEGLNLALKTMIEARPKGSFINIYSEMLKGGKVRPELYLDDLLHMNYKGYEIWRSVVKKHLDSQRNG